MSEPNFDMLWEIHDSPYLSGKKSAFMTYGDFDDERDTRFCISDEEWDALPEWEKQERRDALQKWADWMFRGKK